MRNCNWNWQMTEATTSASSCLTSIPNSGKLCKRFTPDWQGKQTCCSSPGPFHQMAFCICRSRPESRENCQTTSRWSYSLFWRSWITSVRSRYKSSLKSHGWSLSDASYVPKSWTLRPIIHSATGLLSTHAARFGSQWDQYLPGVLWEYIQEYSPIVPLARSRRFSGTA